MVTAAFHSIVPRIAPVPLPGMVRDLLTHALGIDELGRLYEALQAMGDGPIADRLLQHLSVQCTVSDADSRRIPRSGAAIVTCNHPFGILDGAVLVNLLSRMHPNVRILANDLLTVLPELRDLVIPVDPMAESGAAPGNRTGLRRALEHLESGGLLVIFPAGEVSSVQWRERAVADGEWHPAVARLTGIAARRGVEVSIVPAYIGGQNSVMFQAAGLAHPRLRTALLGRELLNKRGRCVEVRFGTPVTADKLKAIPTAREQVEYLRWRTYLLGRREPFKPRTSKPIGRPMQAPRELPQELIAEAIPAEVLAGEIGALPQNCLLTQSGDLEVILATADQIPQTLLELGRLREVTFRAAGEGTGKRLDLDRFDRHYLHLFVWNRQRREIVGAYRLAPSDAASAGGLYTETLFHYGSQFLERLGPALELGRSFVRAEYQRGFAPLLLLWKGIGVFLTRHPEYQVLFGPVSISNEYAAVSRELMVGFLEKYEMLRGWTELVRGRSPFRRRLSSIGLPSAGVDVDDLAAMVGDVEQRPAGVPVLLRQYLRLGGKLLGFNIDTEFSNALDGLILVDLRKTEPKLLDRYLGKEYRKGQYGTH